MPKSAISISPSQSASNAGNRRKRNKRSSVVSFTMSNVAKHARSSSGKTRVNRNQDMASVRSQLISAPATASTIRTTSGIQRFHVEKFTDAFAVVSSTSVATAGDTLVNQVTNIPAFGPRIALLSSLYQRWRLRRLSFRYVSEVATSTAGSFTMAHIQDATWSAPGALNLTTGAPTAVQLIAMLNETAGAKTFPVWVPEVRMSVPVKPDWLYCNALNVSGMVANMTAAGVFVLIANGVLTTSTTFGRLYVDAEVEFKDTDYNLNNTLIQAVNTVTQLTTTLSTDALRFRFYNATLNQIAAPFVIWLPSTNKAICTTPAITAYKLVPIFLAYDAGGSSYTAYSSPIDYLAGNPILGIQAAQTVGTASETLYFPPNFV